MYGTAGAWPGRRQHTRRGPRFTCYATHAAALLGAQQPPICSRNASMVSAGAGRAEAAVVVRERSRGMSWLDWEQHVDATHNGSSAGRTAKQMTRRCPPRPGPVAYCRLPSALFTSLAHHNKSTHVASLLHSPPSSMPRSCGVLFFSTRSPSNTNRTAGWRGSGVASWCSNLALQLSAASSGCPEGCPRSITGYLPLHASRAHLGRGPRSSLNRTH